MIYCNLFIAVSVLRMKKAIAIIVFKKFSRSPEKVLRAVDDQLVVKPWTELN